MSGALAALARYADRRGDAPALDDGAQALSYGRLLRRVGAVAEVARALPAVVGLLAPHGVDWAAAELGLEAAGRTLVPLPDFFSDAQLRHVLSDAGLSAAMVAPGAELRAASLGLSPVSIPRGEGRFEAPPSGDAARIVYTSGSTGAPKGVRLGARQLERQCAALAAVAAASPDDLHLSALPYALLLESLCGLHVPLLAGASVRIVQGLVSAPPAGVPALLAGAAAAARPTTSVLTPQLLAAWVAALDSGRFAAPASLRFLAVGGAPTPEPLLARARALGLPAFQGYGLTECSSVVAVNRPGAERAGTCGRPLSGAAVEIASDGEIVVRGPTVMEGYLRGGAAEGVWRTGDLGALDADGYLVVRGRKDSLIVRPSGRNVSPEWIETMLSADPRIARCALAQDVEGALFVAIEPAAAGVEARIDLDALLADAPAYARPERVFWLEAGGFAARGLLTANGRPRRAALAGRLPSKKEIRRVVS